MKPSGSWILMRYSLHTPPSATWKHFFKICFLGIFMCIALILAYSNILPHYGVLPVAKGLIQGYTLITKCIEQFSEASRLHKHNLVI